MKPGQSPIEVRAADLGTAALTDPAAADGRSSKDIKMSITSGDKARANRIRRQNRVRRQRIRELRKMLAAARGSGKPEAAKPQESVTPVQRKRAERSKVKN
jgi:hypothetical protein